MSLDLGDLFGRISLDSSNFDNTIDGLPGKLKGSGKAMAGGAALVGGAVAVALGTGLNNAINLDSSNRLVAAQLGLSADESARVGALAGDLYASNYGESVEQVQNAIGGVIDGIKGMGLESDEVVSSMTAKVLNYASAYGVESADAIQMVSGLMGSGLATSAENAMDLMTSAMQSVPEALRGDMTDAITEYAPFLATLGMDGEEAFGVLASASEKGMYGIDKTGDALKEFTIRATDMSKASAEGYDAMGMSQEDMTAKLLAGGDDAAGAFADIVHGLQGIEDPTAQASAALALFGTPLEDLGVTEIPNFLGAIDPMGDAFDSVAGAAEKMGDTLGTGPAASMETFARKGEVLLTTLMVGLLPGITAFFDYLNENPDVMTYVAIGLGVVTVAVLAATAAMWAMSLTPVAITIAAIVVGIGLLIAAIVYLVQNWDEVIAWIQGAWGGFVGWLTDGLNGLVGWWNGLWAGMLDGVTAGWEAVIAWFTGIPGAIAAFFTGIGTWLLQTGIDLLTGLQDGIASGYEAVAAWFASIPGLIGQFFATVGVWLLNVGKLLLTGLATGIAAGVIAVWFFFTQLPIIILNMLATAGTWLVQTGLGLLKGLAEGITTGYIAVSEWFTALPGRVLAFLVSFVTLLVTTGRDLLDGLKKGVDLGYATVSTWFTELPGRVLNFLVSFVSLLVSTGKGLLEGMQAGIAWGYETVVAWFVALPSRILNFLIFAATLLISIGQDLLNGMQTGISNGWNGVSSFISGIPGAIMGMLASAGSWLVGAGQWALDGMLNGVVNGWNGLWSFIQGIPGAIGSVFAGAGTWLWDAGTNIVDGLLDGLSNMAGSVGSFFLNLLPGWIVGPFKSALGIASPSKVFAGFGMNIGEGLIGGLDDVQGDLDKRVAEMVTVPPVDLALRLGSSAANAAGYGSDTGVSATPGVSVDARVFVAGDVGWNREELEAETNQRQLDALALAGLGTVGIA